MGLCFRRWILVAGCHCTTSVILGFVPITLHNRWKFATIFLDDKTFWNVNADATLKMGQQTLLLCDLYIFKYWGPNWMHFLRRQFVHFDSTCTEICLWTPKSSSEPMTILYLNGHMRHPDPIQFCGGWSGLCWHYWELTHGTLTNKRSWHPLLTMIIDICTTCFRRIHCYLSC